MDNDLTTLPTNMSIGNVKERMDKHRPME